MKKITTVYNNFVHFISHFSFYFRTFIEIPTIMGILFLCVWVHVYVCETRLQLWVSFLVCVLFFFFETGPLTDLEPFQEH